MIVVRHGQSEFNAAFAVTRRDPGIVDPELTELGHAQARETAKCLADLIRPARLVSSPYARAIATARPIAARFDLTIEVDPLIGEWAAFSCDIGTPTSELARRHPDLALDHLAETWWPSGEEQHHVTARAERFRRESSTEDRVRRAHSTHQRGRRINVCQVFWGGLLRFVSRFFAQLTRQFEHLNEGLRRVTEVTDGFLERVVVQTRVVDL